MRYKITLWILCIILVSALMVVPAVWADSGMASGPQPIVGQTFPAFDSSLIMTPIAMGVIGGISVPISVDNMVNAFTATGISNTMQGVSVPGVSPGIPNLVETPHDYSVNAVEVPNRATVLANGDIVIGSAIGHIEPPATPGYWDNINPSDLHTNMPMITAPALSG